MLAFNRIAEHGTISKYPSRLQNRLPFRLDAQIQTQGLYGAYRSNLKAIIQKAAHDYEMEVDEIEIPISYIHIIIHAPLKYSPSRIMQILKSISAREFFRVKRQYFWGGKLWTKSFYVETVGNRNEKEVKKLRSPAVP